jgi:hypothetical protein
MATRGSFRTHLDRGLDRLVDEQAPTGEIPSVASPLDGSGTPIEGGWVPDTLKFITALAVLAVVEIPDPRAQLLVDRAVAFLRRERETMAQWRYWSADNEQFDLTPPDADDTACCSMAVACRGERTAANRSLLLSNRDSDGRFYTWLVPRGSRDPRVLWGLRDEVRSIVRKRREELWTTTEAEPDDVDVVVNTNVVRYLGPSSPPEVVEWICSVVEAGDEHLADKWHRNPYTLYASIADAHRRGVARFAAIGPTICARIDSAVADGTPTAALDRAFALVALGQFGAGAASRPVLVEQLRETQRDDGSWDPSIFFYGGPDEVFGWASTALSTACALQALHRESERSA